MAERGITAWMVGKWVVDDGGNEKMRLVSTGAAYPVRLCLNRSGANECQTKQKKQYEHFKRSF